MLSATRREALIDISHGFHTIVAMRLVPGAHRIIGGFHHSCIDQARCLLTRWPRCRAHR